MGLSQEAGACLRGVEEQKHRGLVGTWADLISCHLMQQRLRYCPRGSPIALVKFTDDEGARSAFSARNTCAQCAGAHDDDVVSSPEYLGSAPGKTLMVCPDPSPPWSSLLRATTIVPRQCASGGRLVLH